VHLSGPLTVSGVAAVTVNGSYAAASADLSASGTIDVSPGATLSSRQTAGGDPLTAPSTGDAGNLNLTAPAITGGAGARPLAQGGQGFQGGDVLLHAESSVGLGWVLGLASFNDLSATDTIHVGNATLEGKNVSLTTLASTVKVLDLENDLAHDTRAVVLGDVN